MKVVLQNGTEFSVINVTDNPVTVQGKPRDGLSFYFLASTGLEAINAAFSEANCESIRLVENSGIEHVHTGYVIRAALTLIPGESEGSEGLITVTMAKRSYDEEQLLAIRHQIEETAARMTDTQLALCEVYEMVLGTGEEVGVDG